MKFLRTASTQRLLAIIAGALAAIATGTAIAVAAGSGGPVPGQSSLADAIHGALSAPAVQGITARVSFTNHLIDASAIQGADPILKGATGRLWLSNNHQARLELQSDNGDAQALVNNGSFWVYDPSSKTVYEGTVPAKNGTAANKQAGPDKKAADKIPTVAEIQKQLNDVMNHALLSGPIPSDVGGQPAYTVRVSPKHDGGLLGAAELAWDSNHGVPLRIAVYARGNSSPVLELKVDQISYGTVDSSVFAIQPPTGAKVVKVAPHTGATTHEKLRRGKRHAAITGVSAVASHLSFPLVAPPTLVGLPQRSVTLLDWGGTPAALVTYGQNLGGVAVIEQTAKAASTSAGAINGANTGTKGGGEHQGLSLPTVSINGITGQELDTALGTVVRFTRAGVSYTVAGSVPAAAADAAARAL